MLLLLLLVLPAGAWAATETIDFDSPDGTPPGTVVADQYAAQGVRFNVPRSEFPGALPGQVCNRSFRALQAANTWTPPNHARAERCGGGEFGDVGVLIKVHAISVSAYVGGLVRLEAYDAAGALVAAQDANAGSDARTPMRIDRASGDIAWVAFFRPFAGDGGSTTLVLDSMSFDVVEAQDPPPPPPLPDFEVAAESPDRPLGLAPGGSVSTDVTIRRLAGSTGPIRFTAEGLPSGVDPTFSPQPATGGDGQHVRVAFSATRDAPAAIKARVTIRATPEGSSAGTTSKVTYAVLNVAGRVDLRLRGVEVIQAVQPFGTLLPGPLGGGGDYRGTDLATGQQTIARVFAAATGVASPGIGAVVRLRGYNAATGRERAGSPIFAIWAPDGIVQHDAPGVPGVERADPRAAWTFVLPPSWTYGTLHLRAEISPPERHFSDEVPVVECSTPECVANNTFQLRRIPFQRMRNHWIRPVAVVRDGGRKLAPTSRVFDATRAVTPGPLTIPGWYLATLNNTAIDCATLGLGKSPSPKCASAPSNDNPKDDARELDDWKNAATYDLVREWATNYRGPSGPWGDFNVGVNIGTARGAASEAYAITNFDEGPGSQAGDQRPFTSVAHEFFHLLGSPHASACDGAEDAESWAPDERGRLQSLGLDRREGSGGPTKYAGDGAPPPPYRVFADSSTNEMYDFMSYCAASGSGDPNSWVSVRNWERAFALLRAKPVDSLGAVASFSARRESREPVRSAAAASALELSAFVGEAGTQIISVRPPGPQSLAPRRGSDYSLVARDSAGTTVATALLEASRASEGGITFLRGRVPARGVAKVEVVAHGTVLAERSRSRHAPRVRTLGPTRGTRIGGRAPVTVRWQADDSDGDRISASIDYSADGGRSWRAVFVGPNNGRAQIASRLLSASNRARIRVRVTDGFNESRALSPTFRTAGAAPSVRITSPTRDLRSLNHAVVLLSGEAFDDSLRPLRGNRLSWYIGRRRIARGESASVSGLPAGTQRVRLVARDSRGRTGGASVVIRLAQAQPSFVRLASPDRLSHRARTLRLRVASSVPAILRVAGERFRVGRKSRLVRVRVRAGKEALHLRLILATGGARTVRTLVIAR